MIRGLYTAASSMLAARRELDIVSNNLANASTTGFKRAEPVRRSFREMLMERIDGDNKPTELGSLGTGVALEGSFTDFTQGRLKYTGNNLDLALEGSGFFVVQSPGGRFYTRDGNFTVNNVGELVTQAGYQVLGQDGPLTVGENQGLDFDGAGRLHSDNQEIDRLLVVDFEQPGQLKKVGENLYRLEGEGGGMKELTDYRLKSGYLEESNINIIREMARMIETSRSYEANQKVITSLDQTLDKAVNSVGRLG